MRYLFLLAVLMASEASLMAATFFVAPNGNDAWSGRTIDQPFASLQRARDAVRALKAEGLTTAVEVVIRGGEYNLSKPLVLTPQDSGTATCPVTWRAQEGERVVIRGGQKITGWKPWRNGIYQADLKTQGLKGVSFHQLFYANETGRQRFSTRQILARYPNFDADHPRTGGNLYTAQAAARPKEHLIYGEGDIPWDRWKDISQAEVVSTYNRGWQFAITPVLAVDPKTRTITVRPVRGDFIKLNRYFIQNVLEALDSPGEWYLDRKQGILYFHPPEGDLQEGEVIAPILDHIVEVRGTIPYPYAYLNVAYKGPREKCPLPADAPPLNPVEYLVFQGLDFECARQDALRLTGARDCQVVRCRVTNVGNIGINLGGVTTSFAEEGNPRVTPATGHPGGAGGGGQILLLNDPAVRCRVAGCDVWSAGSEGIMLFGDANTAENNHIYDIGLYAKDAPCINLLGGENVARRNTLHDVPRCAIFIKGVNNVAELNDVHHAVLETSDMGGIRMVQRNAYLKGNIIRFNKVTDIPGYGFRWQDGSTYRSPFFTWGIYLDDYTCGTTIFGNIIARTGRGGVMLHGGGDNLVENNIIVNAGVAQIEFQPMNPELGGFPHVYRGNRAVRNILVAGEDAAPSRMVGRTQDMPEFANNLAWFGKQGPLKILGGIDRATVVADPLFEDPAHDDFRLRPDSPAWKLGFKPIPVEQIGCFQSPERASWPIERNYDRFREKPVLHEAADYKPAVQ